MFHSQKITFLMTTQAYLVFFAVIFVLLSSLLRIYVNLCLRSSRAAGTASNQLALEKCGKICLSVCKNIFLKFPFNL